MSRIVWWTIEVEWEDGTREKISEIPDYVAREVDDLLTQIETERNEDERNEDEGEDE